MRRRDFLQSSVLAAAALGTARSADPAFSAPAAFTKTRDLIVATPWRQSASGYSDLAHGFARRLETSLGGLIKCHLTTASGNSIDILNAGCADLHIGFEHDKVAHHAAFGYFAGLPGELGLDAVIFSDWLANGDGQALWDSCAAPFGTKSLMIAHTAIGGGLWSQSGMQQLSGKRIAAQGLARDVFKGMGSEAVQIGKNEAGAALARGSADAVELSHIIEALASDTSAAADYSFLPGVIPNGSTLSVTLKRELWDSFDATMQAHIIGVASNYSQRQTAELRNNDLMLRKLLSETHQAAFLTSNFGLETEVARVAEAVVAEIAARDALSRRIDGAYMALHRHRDRGPLDRPGGAA